MYLSTCCLVVEAQTIFQINEAGFSRLYEEMVEEERDRFLYWVAFLYHMFLNLGITGAVA